MMKEAYMEQKNESNVSKHKDSEEVGEGTLKKN